MPQNISKKKNSGTNKKRNSSKTNPVVVYHPGFRWNLNAKSIVVYQKAKNMIDMHDKFKLAKIHLQDERITKEDWCELVNLWSKEY